MVVEQEQLIQGEGRVLSRKSADRLKASVKSILELLIDSKVFSSGDMKELLDEAIEEESEPEDDDSEEEVEASAEPEPLASLQGEVEDVEPEPPVADPWEEDPAPEVPDEETETPIEASMSLKQRVGQSSWYNRLAMTLSAFGDNFCRLHCLEDAELEKFHLESGETRNGAVDNLMSDLIDLLQGLHKDFKPEYQGNYYPPPMRIAEMYCSEQEAEVQLQLAEDSQAISFDCPVEIEASAKTNNRHPIKGVLFRIDEPSESVPSIGPGLPLFIPRHIAENVLDAVSGLPLDCDDSFSKHANKEIAGVMQCAEINGNDFVVSGILWPWSQGEKVSAIAQNKEDLGMSMNAAARGHEAIVDGRKVFQIDELRLLGANILLSQKATFKKTRLIAAGAATASPVDDEPALDEQSEEFQIAAEEYTPDDSEPTGDLSAMENEAILLQLSALNDTIKSAMDEQADQIRELHYKLITMQTELDEVRADYDYRRSEIQAAAEEEREERFQSSLASIISSQIEKAINTAGAPRRKTHAPVHGETTISASSGSSDLRMRLAEISGELKAQEAMPPGAYNAARVMQLKDEAEGIRVQLGA